MRSLAAALALAAALPALAAAPVPTIEDDYPAALAQARASGKLLVVDAWAPW
jgi:hypothetical protein